ncbi:MAG: phosphoglucosamine mutase [Flavobacteriales bacterium]|nr:phosphoglucosamine mutase [Flavobacteriales bacterium]MDG1766072.1 phosphoglucosamine mutase [Flavobacteriales bacterium]
MALIKSISGIRGTIGGKPGDGLSPIDVVKFAAAFGTFIQKRSGKQRPLIVLGRDARISGEMVNSLVVATLNGLGVDVLDLGLSTTPTVEVAVPMEKADAGIILTASHNPKEWNALKLLNEKGEFIDAEEGAEVLRLAESDELVFAEVDDLGAHRHSDEYLNKHIQAVLDLPLVNVEAIKKANFKVAVDAVNSSGGIFIPALLEALGVAQIEKLYCDPTGHFPHNPEPLPAHLTALSDLVREKKCDLGFVVDPDVDRLAMVCEDGSMFGEEYTLVAVADYILKHTPGNTVSNMSSTRALRDVTEKHGQKYTAAAVGEVNVVNEMKAVNAVIGGEGNGGIIYPELHYGRDALVGVAMFLSHLADVKMTCSELRDAYPKYTISKNKIALEPSMDVDGILKSMAHLHREEQVDTKDGVKIDFEEEWVHLRKSNTEPIIRIYAESRSEEKAEALALKTIQEIRSFL